MLENPEPGTQQSVPRLEPPSCPWMCHSPEYRSARALTPSPTPLHGGASTDAWGRKGLRFEAGELGAELTGPKAWVSPDNRLLSCPLECARVFHAAGARLVLCGRNAEALEELSQELAASRALEVSEPGGLAWGRGTARPLRVFTVLREVSLRVLPVNPGPYSSLFGGGRLAMTFNVLFVGEYTYLSF